MKLTVVKTPPTKKELRESREFYESIGPLGKRKRKAKR